MERTNFDPYYKWLGIPPEQQPANHYRLLGVELLESDPDVIEAAALRQISHIRTYAIGPKSQLSQELLNEVAAARVTLLNPARKAEYDQTLMQSQVGGMIDDARPQQPSADSATEEVRPPSFSPSIKSAKRAALSEAKKKANWSRPLLVAGFLLFSMAVFVASVKVFRKDTAATQVSPPPRTQAEGLSGAKGPGNSKVASDQHQTSPPSNALTETIPQRTESHRGEGTLPEASTKPSTKHPPDPVDSPKTSLTGGNDPPPAKSTLVPTASKHTWSPTIPYLPNAYSNAVSGDGLTCATGSFSEEGTAVRVYRWDATDQAWLQRGKDITTAKQSKRFGVSVSLNQDGSIVAIGDDMSDGNGRYGRAGSVHVYRWIPTGSSWRRQGPAIPGKATADSFGQFVDLNADGNIVAIGARNADAAVTNKDGGQGNSDDEGQVSIFRWDVRLKIWNQVGAPINGEAVDERAGSVLDLSADGTTIAVGSPLGDLSGRNSGHVRVYRWNPSLLAWAQLGDHIQGRSQGEFVGSSVALSSDGKKLALHSAWTNDLVGHIRIYQWDGQLGKWLQIGGDIKSAKYRSNLRNSVHLSSDGGSLVCVGGNGSLLSLAWSEAREKWTTVALREVKPEANHITSLATDSACKTVALNFSGGVPTKILKSTPSGASQSTNNNELTTLNVTEKQPNLIPYGDTSILEIGRIDAANAKKHQQAWAKYLDQKISFTNSAGIEMVFIPPGVSVLGSPFDPNNPEKLYTNQTPLYLSRHEITEEQFYKVCDLKRNASSSIKPVPSEKTSKLPAVQVDTNAIQSFLVSLSSREGRTYSLPTSQTWEYAFRAGARGHHPQVSTAGELNNSVWFGNNSGNRRIGSENLWFANTRDSYFSKLREMNCTRQAVGRKRENTWGLQDMIGNVWEQTSSMHLLSQPDAERIIIKGGSYWEHFNSPWLTASFETVHSADQTNDNIGFRIATVVKSSKFICIPYESNQQLALARMSNNRVSEGTPWTTFMSKRVRKTIENQTRPEWEFAADPTGGWTETRVTRKGTLLKIKYTAHREDSQSIDLQDAKTGRIIRLCSNGWVWAHPMASTYWNWLGSANMN